VTRSAIVERLQHGLNGVFTKIARLLQPDRHTVEHSSSVSPPLWNLQPGVRHTRRAEADSNPPGTFAFGALGDAPYYPWEAWRYPLVLQDMDGHDLAFAIHVGDIFWYPCSDEMYERSLRWFNGLKRPLIYVPGDNEWADCWTQQEGGCGAVVCI
jgi:hypothetical protein